MEESREVFAAYAAAALREGGIGLRPLAPGDIGFIADVYASAREEELRVLPWSDAQKRAFTDSQCQLQDRHYVLHYPHAERLLIYFQDEPVGRVYVDVATNEVRLMEITLLQRHRNHGIGTRIVSQVIAFADKLGRRTSLHVEPFNPARRMYVRMGFEPQETRGLYELMVRPVPPS